MELVFFFFFLHEELLFKRIPREIQGLDGPTIGIRAKAISEESNMAKKMTNDRKLAAPVSSLKLSKTNYRVWSMAMEVYLDSHDLWQAIVGENVVTKKDRFVLSVIINAIPEDQLVILDAKKTAKENWEILQQRNLGVDRVIQSLIQGLK